MDSKSQERLAWWSLIVGGNLLVPLSLASSVVANGGRFGMYIGIVTLWLAGALALQRYCALRRPLLAGGVLVALLQMTPILQLLAGAAGVETAVMLGQRLDASTPTQRFTEFGGFAATFVTGALLITAALLVGAAFDAIVKTRREYGIPGRHCEPAKTIQLGESFEVDRKIRSERSGMAKRLPITLGVAAAALLGCCMVGHWAETRRQATNARYAAEAHAVLEAYLRNEPGAAGLRPGDPNHKLDRAAAVDQFGELQGITGDGYTPAMWNIQDYHYLRADRTARFAKATIPLSIYVTEGRVTALGETAVRVTALHYDRANGLLAWVAHPKLVDP